MSAGVAGTCSARRSSRTWLARAPRVVLGAELRSGARRSAAAAPRPRPRGHWPSTGARSGGPRYAGEFAAVVHCGTARARPAPACSRDAPGDRPADVTLAVADHEVLVRDTQLRRERQGFIDRGEALEAHQVEIGGLRAAARAMLRTSSFACQGRRAAARRRPRSAPSRSTGGAPCTRITSAISVSGTAACRARQFALRRPPCTRAAQRQASPRRCW